MPDCRRHSPNLAVAPLAETQLDPEILYGFTDSNRRIARWNRRLGIAQAGLGREGFSAIQDNAIAQSTKGFLAGQPFDEDEVGFCHMVHGIEQAFVQLSLVGQKQ